MISEFLLRLPEVAKHNSLLRSGSEVMYCWNSWEQDWRVQGTWICIVHITGSFLTMDGT